MSFADDPRPLRVVYWIVLWSGFKPDSGGCFRQDIGRRPILPPLALLACVFSPRRHCFYTLSTVSTVQPRATRFTGLWRLVGRSCGSY